MLLVNCPKCRNNMLYNPVKNIKSKRCVYCGKTFTVKGENTDRILKRFIKSF